MKRVKNLFRALVMMAVVCAMLTGVVFAAGDGSVWIRNTESSTEQVTTTWIVTDTTVTDGLVELTYDSETLTYQDVEINEAYVAMYAVNADEPGTVKISWVAPDAIDPEENVWLLKVNFSGTGSVTVSGAVNGGEDMDFAAVDTSELEKAILEAEGLYEDDYTARSWKTLEKALAMAKDVLDDPTADQSEVNAAAETLNNGMASLELKLITNNAKLYKAILKAQGLCEDKYTTESWAELEEALAKAKKVNANRWATQKQVDEATEALNDAIANLELKPVEPSEPSEPGNPGGSTGGSIIGQIISGWIGVIKKTIGFWFGGWGN